MFHSGCPWDTVCVDTARVFSKLWLIFFIFFITVMFRALLSLPVTVIWWDTTSSTGMGTGGNGNKTAGRLNQRVWIGWMRMNHWEWIIGNERELDCKKNIPAHLHSQRIYRYVAPLETWVTRMENLGKILHFWLPIKIKVNLAKRTLPNDQQQNKITYSRSAYE